MLGPYTFYYWVPNSVFPGTGKPVPTCTGRYRFFGEIGSRYRFSRYMFSVPVQVLQYSFESRYRLLISRYRFFTDSKLCIFG